MMEAVPRKGSFKRHCGEGGGVARGLSGAQDSSSLLGGGSHLFARSGARCREACLNKLTLFSVPSMLSHDVIRTAVGSVAFQCHLF